LEMFFYAVFAVTLFLDRLRGLLAAVVFLIGIVALHTTGIFGAQGVLAAVSLNFWADPIILNFVLGMGVGVIYMRGLRTTKIDNLLLLAIAVACATVVHFNTDMLRAFPENHILPRVAWAHSLILGSSGSKWDCCLVMRLTAYT
jgi:peptidoglycan/LPS O-acetylase OafA/YrhL